MSSDDGGGYLVSLVGVVVESEWEAEGRVVLLQQCVPVAALVQGSDGRLQLPESRLLRLLDAPPAAQVAPHHPLGGEVEAQVAALPTESSRRSRDALELTFHKQQKAFVRR